MSRAGKDSHSSWQQIETTGAPNPQKEKKKKKAVILLVTDSLLSLKCHESYLLPAPPHAKIHLHVLHH